MNAIGKIARSLQKHGALNTVSKAIRYPFGKAKPRPLVSNTGYCHCCRRETTFQSEAAWLRDNYVCLNCFSIPRQRHIQHILDTHFSAWQTRDMHESSPSNNLLSQYCPSYSQSQYFSDTPVGIERDGVRCENLEQLTFGDETFDIFVTQDVFEHIFNPSLAARDIMRVLRPGGFHIFTAPKHKDIRKSYPRALLANGGIEYLLEEQYHGNPVGDGRALVTWDYGDDLEFLLAEWTGCPITTYMTRDRSLGLDGEFLDVFVIRKPTK